METLPPVILGAIILGAFIVAALLHHPLQWRFVKIAPVSSRPKKQFYLEFSLAILAGLLAVVFNLIAFDFPIGSGLSLLFGCAVIGLFMGLDLALAREREIILDTLRSNRYLPSPERFFPVTRKFTIVAVATSLFVALVIIMVIARDIAWLVKIESTGMSMLEAQISVANEIFFVMVVLLALVINLVISYSKNLKLLFQNQTTVLEGVTGGDLSNLVPVATNDEFGVIAGHTNTMIRSLRHRIELMTALKVAEEVQQNLLPHQPPQYEGLDLAGTSIYCDETGGDYFDYIDLPGGKLGIVVADASDHGIGAAIHMTTARAFLLHGAKYADDPAELIGDVNRYLVKDSSQSGRFVSIFLLEIDPSTRVLRWVRAGHEPAILFDPHKKECELLTGEGAVLGFDDGIRYRHSSRTGWTPGSVIVIGTDGIHEALNAEKEMYGRERLQDQISKNHSSSAEGIKDSIIADLKQFQGDTPQADDVTLVVAKLF
jgi:sigma-B regulation protein RsbU (phosphoserine phosphatase)